MLIEILATRMGVAVGRHGLEDILVDGQQGDDEGDQDVPPGLLAQAVGDDQGSGLEDDTQHVETDAAGP
jgi:hypothetical protein